MAINRNDLPLGFAMKLAMTPGAMAAFGGMTAEEQKQVLDRCHRVQSKAEMQKLVDSLMPGE